MNTVKLEMARCLSNQEFHSGALGIDSVCTPLDEHPGKSM